ncbi:ubiquitin-related modifier 1 isoform X1 [Herpailurus yagouaroundi]|uniref:ubiquitin-related modifier 1 isoform X1 n=1 Tax=Herpailurus yagouaroundi TaxID=1608482 RepID=UPI001AD7BD73|nr:ubiquitin-related modifier 1 isoform X1 [Puma yagouaroundi]
MGPSSGQDAGLLWPQSRTGAQRAPNPGDVKLAAECEHPRSRDCLMHYVLHKYLLNEWDYRGCHGRCCLSAPAILPGPGSMPREAWSAFIPRKPTQRRTRGGPEKVILSWNLPLVPSGPSLSCPLLREAGAPFPSQLGPQDPDSAPGEAIPPASAAAPPALAAEARTTTRGRRSARDAAGWRAQGRGTPAPPPKPGVAAQV